jgi:hypothetical protein
MKSGYIVYWSIFTNELITHYGDIKSNTLFGHKSLVKRFNYKSHSTIPKTKS